MLRTVLAAILLALLAACAHQHPTAVELGPAIPIADRSSEFQERADRGRIRPLQPPAAPDARSPVAARPAPQRGQESAVRTVRPSMRTVRMEPAATTLGDRWARLRQCESGGNYADNTGNGFYGAYQFTLGTWASVGGVGNPALAPPAEQDMRAQLLYARRGASPWPICGRWLR